MFIPDVTCQLLRLVLTVTITVLRLSRLPVLHSSRSSRARRTSPARKPCDDVVVNAEKNNGHSAKNRTHIRLHPSSCTDSHVPLLSCHVLHMCATSTPHLSLVPARPSCRLCLPRMPTGQHPHWGSKTCWMCPRWEGSTCIHARTHTYTPDHWCRPVSSTSSTRR